MKEKYLNSAFLAITSVKVAEIFNFLPEPQTFFKAAFLALATGFLGGAGRWIFDKAKRKFKL